MKWDEDDFGLKYDLDLFNIVAVPYFNMRKQKFEYFQFQACPDISRNCYESRLCSNVGSYWS